MQAQKMFHSIEKAYFYHSQEEYIMTLDGLALSYQQPSLACFLE